MSIRLHRAAIVLSALLACASVGAAPGRNADKAIADQVRDAIFKRADLAGDEISVQTRDGVVWLHGLVDTNVERETAETVARQTPGVTRVVNALELRNHTR